MPNAPAPPTPSPDWLAYRASRLLWPYFEDAPWIMEPDQDFWQTAAGLPGAVIRDETTGHLCGYAAVPPSSIAHGVSDHAINADDPPFVLRVPVREITFARGGRDPLTASADATDATWWWIGFAWSHAGDLVPMFAGEYSEEVVATLEYRTWEQVHDDVEALARELASLAKRTDR